MEKTGNEVQWELAYQEFAPILYNYGVKLVSNVQLVEDCLQDVFADLWQKREKLGEIQYKKAYLQKVFRRTIFEKIVAYKKKQAPEFYFHDIDFHISFSFESVVINDELAEEQKKKLQLALKGLTPRQKESVFLKFYEGYTYEEVAEIMGLEKSAVYSLIYKAMTHLRNSLQSHQLTLDSYLAFLPVVFTAIC